MLEITIEAKVVLPDYWMSKEEWDSAFKDDLDALIELFEEDTITLLEDCGGIKGLLKSARWVEEV